MRWASLAVLVGLAAAEATAETAAAAAAESDVAPNMAPNMAQTATEGGAGKAWQHSYWRGRVFDGAAWAKRDLRGVSSLALLQEAQFVRPRQFHPQPHNSQYAAPPFKRPYAMAPPPGAFLQVGASPPQQQSSTWKAEKSAATRKAISDMLAPNSRGSAHAPLKKGSHSQNKNNAILAPKFSNPPSTSSSTAKDDMRFASSQQKQKAGAAADPWWVNPPPWWLPSPPEWGAPPPSVYSPFYSPGTIPNQFQAQAMPAYNPQPAPNQYVPQQYVRV